VTLTTRADRAFEMWGRLVIGRPWFTIALTLTFSLVLGALIPGIRFANSPESFLHPDDPTLLALHDFQEQFPRDDVILVGIETLDVFDPTFLKTLRSLHREIETEVPHVDEVTSLLNARAVRGEADALIVEGLLDEWPESTDDLARLRERVLSNRLYVNRLVSEDAHFTILTIVPVGRLLSEETDVLAAFDQQETSDAQEGDFAGSLQIEKDQLLIAALRGVLARYQGPDIELHLAGMPILAGHLGETMQKDLTRFAGLSVGVIAALLFILFRRLSGVILPVLIVGLSTASTLGMMSLLDIPLSVVSEILPSLLLTVGVCDSVHLLTITYQRLSRGDEQREAVLFALRNSGLAILMTSVTTALGLLSFVTAELKPVADLGIVAPIGVVFAFLYTITLLPALVVVSPLQVRSGRNTEQQILNRLLLAVGAFGTEYPRRVVAFSGIIIIVGLVSALQVQPSFDTIRWFPEDDPLRRATETIDRNVNGTAQLEILIDSGRENGLTAPQTLERLDTLSSRALAYEDEAIFVGQASSIVDIVKEIHQALNENDPTYHRIPDNRPLVAQELLLFESGGSDDLEEVSDSQYQLARMTLRLPRIDAMHYVRFMQEFEPTIASSLGKDLPATTTGSVTVLARTTRNISLSMIRSYLFAAVAVTLIMIVSLGSLRLGLISIAPNLAPIVITLGTMYWMRIPLDATTLMIGSIILGLAVDDTIHFLHGFDRSFAETNDVRVAVQTTLRTTGTALLFTSLVLTGGFLVFLFGYMHNIQNFGLLAALGAMVAFIADVLLVPALLTLIVRKE
jgi:predicted RND superfamily exporter protein